MKWNEIGGQSCSVARALAEVGERWSLLIIRDAFLGARRFGEFVEGTGAARNIVAARLEELVAVGILRKVPYQEHPPRYEYKLTRKGVDLWPAIMALVHWGDKYHDDGRGHPYEHTHRSCGHRFHVEPACSECGEIVDPRDVEVRRGDAFDGE